MSDFLHEFRFYLRFLYYTGLCPLRVNLNNHESSNTICTKISTIYLLFVFTLISYILFVQLSDLHSFLLHKSTGSTVVAIKWLQSVFNTWIYVIVILKSIQNRKLHADFLNGIQNFDRSVDGSKLESHQYFRQMTWLNALTAFGVWSLNFGTMHVIRHGATHIPWSRQIYELIHEIIFTTFALASLYAGSLVILLNRRYSMLCGRLKNELAGSTDKVCRRTIELFDLIWKLIDQFQRVFGLIIALNAAVDLLLLIITMYYHTLIGLLRMVKFDLEIFVWVCMTYATIPILKNISFVWAMNNVGERVC